MDIIREAGWPIWVVLALGTLSLVQAVRHRQGAPGSDVTGAIAATILVGLSATLWGIRLSINAVPEAPDDAMLWLVVRGAKESFGNLIVAGVLGAAAALVATVGRRRADIASAP